jgi:hypothetical protein
MFRRVVSVMCLAALVSAGAAFAATTSRLTGEVFDNDGAPMPGVTVQISSDKLIGGPQIAIADENGRFVFNLLPVGIYTVEATLVGFKPASGQVQVSLDRAAQIVFNMVPEQFGGEIQVSAQVPVVDTAQVNTSVTFDEDYLQKAAVGSANRDYLSMIGQAAGVAGSGNASVFGGSNGDNSFLIDGLNTTDPVTGTFGTNFNYDAIQEMNFQTGGFEAEFGQATGGIVNLVTKSGGNEFSGSFDVRYRNENMTENGDHFDRDEQDSLYQSLSGTLGGPILRDKLWFFASLEKVDTSRQNQGAQFPREYDGTNYIGKITWQIADSHRAVLKYTGAPADIPGINSSQFVEESAKGLQYQGSDIWQAELNSVLSESVLLNASVGVFANDIDVRASTGNTDKSGHRNEDTLVDSNNFLYSSLNDRFRDEIRVNTTIFVDRALGSHEVKVGAEYSDMEFNYNFFYNGDGFIFDVSDGSTSGYQFQDLNGDGYFNSYVTIEEPLETNREWENSYGDILTFFAQDAWRPHPNVTVKPGVRWDRVTLANHVEEQIADMDRWQPRLGIAWDIAGNSKYVLRASGGRFMDPTALSIPSFASGVTQTYRDYGIMEYYCNLTRGLRCSPEDFPSSFGDPIYWTNREGIEYVLFDNQGQADIYEPAQTLDQAGVGQLQAPYADEFIIAFETQIARETSLEITYVNKQTKEIIEDTCANNTWAWGDGDYPDLDDKGTWTTAGECNYYMITNMPTFYRDYEGIILQAETRQNRLHLLGSYTYSESTGNTANGPAQTYATALADFFPVHFVNRDGYLPDHREHRIKVNGYYLFPHNWTVGFDGFFSSAGHQTLLSTCDALNNYGSFQSTIDQAAAANIDTDLVDYCYTGDNAFLGTTDIYLEDRGNFTTKSTWQLDMQASKTWNLKKVDLTIVGTVYNIFNRELDLTFNSRAFRQEINPDTLEGMNYCNESFDPACTPASQPENFIYDEYYGTDGSPVLVGLGEATSYRLPRRYEVGFRIEF